MPNTFRRRLTHAATIGTAVAALVVATQYFIALPIGNQPQWLVVLAFVASTPAAYVLLPLQGVVEGWIGLELGTGYLMEVSTPFGPALRAGREDLLLMALGTIVMVGLVAYGAAGIQEMLSDRHAATSRHAQPRHG